jgi:hypothetical protein
MALQTSAIARQWLSSDYVVTPTDFFLNPILFAICTSTFSKLCKRRTRGDPKITGTDLLRMRAF